MSPVIQTPQKKFIIYIRTLCPKRKRKGRRAITKRMRNSANQKSRFLVQWTRIGSLGYAMRTVRMFQLSRVFQFVFFMLDICIVQYMAPLVVGISTKLSCKYKNFRIILDYLYKIVYYIILI